MNSTQLQTLDLAELDCASGGLELKTVGKVAKAVGKKALLPLTVGSAAWSAYSSYDSARDQGQSVGRSLWEGAKGAVRDVTAYDLWGN